MQIDFYILETESLQKAHFFTCRLIEKIYTATKETKGTKQIYIHLSSLNEAERFDTLLWTYKEESFIPHQLYHPTNDAPPPIQIGWGDVLTHEQDTLINLHPEFPSFFQQFTYVKEIVFSDPSVQQLARERFKQYRDKGLTIHTHKLKANEL